MDLGTHPASISSSWMLWRRLRRSACFAFQTKEGVGVGVPRVGSGTGNQAEDGEILPYALVPGVGLLETGEAFLDEGKLCFRLLRE